MPKMIGNMNATVGCVARLGRKKFSFDGTVTDLVNSAISKGASVGNSIITDIGKFIIIATPYDNRA